MFMDWIFIITSCHYTVHVILCTWHVFITKSCPKVWPVHRWGEGGERERERKRERESALLHHTKSKSSSTTLSHSLLSPLESSIYSLSPFWITSRVPLRRPVLLAAIRPTCNTINIVTSCSTLSPELALCVVEIFSLHICMLSLPNSFLIRAVCTKS